MGVGAEFQVDLVGVIDEFLGKILPDQFGKFTAHLTGKGQLAVRKGARAGKAGGDGAGGLAVDAVTHFGFGAVTALHRFALFDQQDLEILGMAALAQQFQGGEDAGRTGADDDEIVLVLHGERVSFW